MIRPVLEWPDPRLMQISQPVLQVTQPMVAFCQDLVDTLKDREGLGLAAPQLGTPRRIVALDLSLHFGEVVPGILMVNPTITTRSDELVTWEEGCLSLPLVVEEVERPAKVTCKWQELRHVGTDEWMEREFEDMWAVAVQHELDHLDGVLFFDHVSKLKRDIAKRALHKRARQRGSTNTLRRA